MKLYLLRVSCPSFYTVAAYSQEEAREQAVERFKRRNTTLLEPEVEIVSAEEINLGFWDRVDGAIDEAKERRR